VKRIFPDSTWPDSWRNVYHYDELEVYGHLSRPGYANAYRLRFERTLDAVGARVPVGARVLDVGAAQGNFSLALAERGFDVTWNDFRAELAGYVQLKHERGLLRFSPGNIFELEFPEPFDLVLITEVIEHVAHPDQFLKRVAELAKPAGIVVMTTPNGEYFRNRLPKFSEYQNPEEFEATQFQPDGDGHIFLLHLDEIPILADAAGLRIVNLELFTNSLTNGSAFLSRALKLIPRALVDGLERITSGGASWLHRKINIQMLAVMEKTTEPA
jgi:2-polyprenyl-6-hydroxyphenyl methylase/3-demethylubiquinone-9 3-methyltransferase